MESNYTQKGCTGRCENCNVSQRTYCASQMAYYAQQEIAEIKAILASFVRPKEEDSVLILRDEEKVVEAEIIKVSEEI